MEVFKWASWNTVLAMWTAGETSAIRLHSSHLLLLNWDVNVCRTTRLQRELSGFSLPCYSTRGRSRDSRLELHVVQHLSTVGRAHSLHVNNALGITRWRHFPFLFYGCVCVWAWSSDCFFCHSWFTQRNVSVVFICLPRACSLPGRSWAIKIYFVCACYAPLLLTWLYKPTR